LPNTDAKVLNKPMEFGPEIMPVSTELEVWLPAVRIIKAANLKLESLDSLLV